MHGAEPRVIAVRQRVRRGFAERSQRIVGDADAGHADLKLPLAVARAEARLQLFHHPQQRPTEEVVDLHLAARQHLERDLVRGQQRGQHIFAPEEQQTEHGRRLIAVAALHSDQRSGQFQVTEFNQCGVARILSNGAAVALELQGIQRVKADFGKRLRREVQPPAVRLLRLHLVEKERAAVRFAAAADHPAKKAAP